MEQKHAPDNHVDYYRKSLAIDFCGETVVIMRAHHWYFNRLFSVGLVALLFSSCGEKSEWTEERSDEGIRPGLVGHSASAVSENGGVGGITWPELNALEKVAFMAGVLAENKDREGLLHQRTAILEVGWAVSPKTMPENATNQDHVHKLLGDLSRLVNGMARSDMSDERLFALAAGLYPVVEELIKASGVSRNSAN